MDQTSGLKITPGKGRSRENVMIESKIYLRLDFAYRPLLKKDDGAKRDSDSQNEADDSPSHRRV
jgi:hypothetical protein